MFLLFVVVVVSGGRGCSGHGRSGHGHGRVGGYGRGDGGRCFFMVVF